MEALRQGITVETSSRVLFSFVAAGGPKQVPTEQATGQRHYVSASINCDYLSVRSSEGTALLTYLSRLFSQDCQVEAFLLEFC